jgi:hypothetical protein
MLIITGTGRSGTTAIAQWLDELGLLPNKGEYIPQHFSGLEPADVSRVNAAIWLGNDAPMQSLPAQEHAIRAFEYTVLKDDKFFYGNVLDTWLSVRKDIKFLISIRNFHKVEKSRRAAGQLNKIRTPEQLNSDFGKFLSRVILNKLPYEIICFPDFLDTYEEVYDKVMALSPELNIDKEEGRKAWNKVIDKTKVHF